MAELRGDAAEAALLRDTADAWNAAIERWTYASGTALAGQVGVEGYYVRIAPPEGVAGQDRHQEPPGGCDRMPASDVVSPDALALVRFGLRAADYPRILNTVRVIDPTLKVDLPRGPCWRRYNGDGYGEHDDGRHSTAPASAGPGRY